MAWFNDDELNLLENIEKRLWSAQKQLTQIAARLDQIAAKETTTMIDVTKLTAELTNNTNATNAVVALVNTIATELKNIPPSNDPVTQAAIDAAVATLTTNDATIAAAVVAGTPAAQPPTS
jgi:hypothetical protein